MLDMFQLVINKIDQMDKRIDSIQTEQKSMRQEMNEMKQELREMNQRQAVFEHETSYKLGALFDGYQMNLEHNEELKQRLDKMQRIK